MARNPGCMCFFGKGVRGAKGTVELHLAVQGGKLKDASVDTSDGDGGQQARDEAGTLSDGGGESR